MKYAVVLLDVCWVILLDYNNVLVSAHALELQSFKAYFF